MPDPYLVADGADAPTLLLHKPAGVDPGDRIAMAALMPPGQPRIAILALERHAAGMQVMTRDPRLLRRIRDDANKLEQEFIVEVDGEIAPYGLNRLRHGLSFNGRNLPPISASWQNETRLRLALAGPQPGQIASMCRDVGLGVVAMKRIRIGRIPLAKLPSGEWRVMAENEKL